jgi:hypothetical protein
MTMPFRMKIKCKPFFFIFVFSLSACHSIRNNTIEAAPYLPDADKSSAQSISQTQDCASNRHGETYADACKPVKDQRNCWDYNVRTAYPEMCKAVDNEYSTRHRGG